MSLMPPDDGLCPKPPLFLFIDQAYGVGGVQTYLRMLREIAHSYRQADGGIVECLSYLDSSEDAARHRRPVGLTAFTGSSGSRLRFVFQALRMAWRSPGGAVIVGYIGLLRAAWLLKKVGLIDSYIVILYGVEAWSRKGPMDRAAIVGAESVVALSRFTAREFSRLNGFDEALIRVIAPAVDPGEPASAAPRAADGPFRLLSVGRLSRRDQLKGFDQVLRAFQALDNECPDVRLTIAGDGDDLPRLRLLASELKIEDRVTFAGAVTEPELARLYADCDAFVMLSRKEGFGLVFLEAMTFGKPCVGAEAAGAIEAIEHGVDGFLVDALDVSAQAACLRRLHGDKDLRRRMGERAGLKVREKHLYGQMEAAWHALLRQLPGRSSP